MGRQGWGRSVRSITGWSRSARPSTLVLVTLAIACADPEAEVVVGDGGVAASEGGASGAGPLIVGDYCEPPAVAVPVLLSRPQEDEAPIDDVNWFARPVPHDGDERLIAFASHNQNYLYDLTRGRRIKIPDRSDAVATPDGKYMTVPSYYTADSNTRFYPIAPMLAALERGEDVDDLEPTFIHDHPAMKRVYYQSTALLGATATRTGRTESYRLMFSGSGDESQFRIVDYAFHYEGTEPEPVRVEASPPMAICPQISNDLNTPFISKDGRYVAAYTSEQAGSEYTPGASLKLFELTSVDPEGATSSCRLVADFGFAAGKADFSFDGSMLAFHSSQGAYLTPFVNGGLPANTITDVIVARLETSGGRIEGVSGLQRLTVSVEAGVGSYFPSFFQDGSLFYIENAVPRESEEEKRFHFRVVDPRDATWRTPTFETQRAREGWTTLGRLWERACLPPSDAGSSPEGIFPLADHEAPLQALPLTADACTALVRDSRADGASGVDDWSALESLCSELGG